MYLEVGLIGKCLATLETIMTRWLTREMEVGLVRREQETGLSHQRFSPSPNAPAFLGWNRIRTHLSIQVTSIAFLDRTESGPFTKAGKWIGNGGAGQGGLFLGPVTGLTKSSSLQNRTVDNVRKIVIRQYSR